MKGPGARAAWKAMRAKQLAETPARAIVERPRPKIKPGARRLRMKLRKKRARQWHSGIRMLIRTKRAVAIVRELLAAFDEHATSIDNPAALLARTP